MKRKFILKFVLPVMSLLVALAPLRAQIDENPVRWTVAVEHAEAGTPGVRPGGAVGASAKPSAAGTSTNPAPSANAAGPAYRILFTAQIESPWHLYDLGPYVGGPNATTFTFEPNAAVELVGAPYHITRPTRVRDELFGMEIGYFVREAVFGQDVRLAEGVEGARLKVNVEWMVCNDKSCLPPADEDLVVVIANNPRGTDASGISAPIGGNASGEFVTAAAGASAGSLWNVIIKAILWGFAALLTPCVFPMVPMTVSFFMKSGGTRAKGRTMASLYGLSIIALYTLPIAAIILITRIVGGEAVTADLFNWLATHWFPNVLFFLVFMIFAASFFGAFEITLPGWMVSKSDAKADKGGMLGVFFMALTLVLVSFSCTGPIVGSVLLKSTTGEVWAPVITMFAFSVAFALPFTLFAFFPSILNNLPKSGSWLNSVKVVLGFLELALGLKFLSIADQTYHWGILDREVYLALWIVIFSLLGLYLLGKLTFKHDTRVETISVTRLALSIVTFSFVVYMIPGMWGAPLKGLSGYLPPLHTQDFVMGQGAAVPTGNSATVEGRRVKHSDFLSLPHGLQGFFDFDEALDYARAAGKPIFLDYTGHGCVNCREMEARVWSHPDVLDLLRNRFVILALYSDDKTILAPEEWITTESGKVLKGLGKINAYHVHRRFGINAQPYYLILDNDGRPLSPGMGYNLDVNEYLQFLEEGLRLFEAGR